MVVATRTRARHLEGWTVEHVMNVLHIARASVYAFLHRAYAWIDREHLLDGVAARLRGE